MIAVNRRTAALASLAAAAALLAGCATGPRTLAADVSTFGEWPAQRAPGRYAFERLPSQQARAADTERVENAARAALQAAGFTESADGGAPDVLVQVGLRVTRTDRGLWDDPLWWRGGFGAWRYGPWIGPGWSLSARMEPPRYDREVALLLRDRSSGRPLFEARATAENLNGAALDEAGLSGLFQAALTDFPRAGINPRRVVVTVGS